MRVAIVAALVLAAAAAGVSLRASRASSDTFAVHGLVSDRRAHAATRDPALVNAWGLAATPSGPWWTANEADDTSTLYAGSGRKQLLTVHVAGGPTGIAAYGGRKLLVGTGPRADPARFVYACEDGKLRAWTPTVPGPWSTQAEVVADEGGKAAVFRGVAIAGDRVYATDFHNGAVDVFDSAWHLLHAKGAFADPRVPSWYAPFGIQAIGSHIFVTYVYRAPVDGNDAPTGGYVDEFSRSGKLVARVARMGVLNAPWGLALAPTHFGSFGGDLLVGDFGDGRIHAFHFVDGAWRLAGALQGAGGKPIAIDGLWGLAFGNGGTAGARETLFFTSGPHAWRGETELAVHGLLGSISAS